MENSERERDHSGYQAVDGGYNIQLDVKTKCKDVDWTHLAQDRFQWWSVVNMVMNSGFYKSRKSSWPAELLLASQEGLSVSEFEVEL
jgi:hypothetical protein